MGKHERLIMGITNLITLIRRCPNAMVEVPISDLEDQRMAIDANLFLYSNWSVCHRQEVESIDVAIERPNPDKVFERFSEFFRQQIMKLMSYRILPVFVTDGVQSQLKQDNTRDGREADRKKTTDLIESLRQKIKEAGPLVATNETDQLQRKLKNASHITLTPVNRKRFYNMITDLGLPLLKASGLTGEADKLCAYLLKKGKVGGILSKDKDLLTFGSPYLFTQFGQYRYNSVLKRSEPHLVTIKLEQILSDLDVTYEQFVDICILAGCDYGPKLRGKGIVSIYELIKKHGSIEKLPKNLDVSKTNYKEARSFFTTTESYQDLCTNYKTRLEIDKSKLDSLDQSLTKYHLSSWYNQYKMYFEMFSHYQLDFVNSRLSRTLDPQYHIKPRGDISDEVQINNNIDFNKLNQLEKFLESHD